MCGNEGGVFLEGLIIGLRFDESREPIMMTGGHEY